MLESLNFLGALVAVTFYILAIFVFIFRIIGKPIIGERIGYFEFVLAINMIYLIVKAPQHHRPILYYIQIGLMLSWIVVELLLDYILKLDFRKVKWIVIIYVMLFFAGTGGMLGVASLAGSVWTIISVILFLIMAVLAFVQHAVTGN